MPPSTRIGPQDTQKFTVRNGITGDRLSIEVEAGTVAQISEVASNLGQERKEHLGRECSFELVLVPLLVDLQVNGFRGVDFLKPDLAPEEVEFVAESLLQDGVVAAVPTITTQSFDRIEGALQVLDRAYASSSIVRECFPSIHLEGPYLSAEDGPRGAHPVEHIRPPDWEEFSKWQRACQGRIRLVTLSPEYSQAPEFISRCVSSGVAVAIGHTSASRSQILQAVEAGATLSTHLGNGAHGVLPRHPNYLWDQLAEDRLTAMVIADGHHLPDEVLKCISRCKPAGRFMAVSDLTGLGGMPAGRYPDTILGDVEILENGKMVVGGQRQYLAGAALPLWRAIPRLLAATDLSVRQVISATATLPAKHLGIKTELQCEPSQLSGLLLQIDVDDSGNYCQPEMAELRAVFYQGQVI